MSLALFDVFAMKAIWGAGFPAAIAIVAVAAGRARSELPADRPARDWAAFRFPILFAAAVFFSFLGLNKPGVEAWHRVLIGVPIAVAICGTLIAVTPRWWWLRAAMLVVLAGVVTWRAWPTIQPDDPNLVKILLPAGILALAMALEPFAFRRADPTLPLAAAIAASASAGVVVVSGDISFGVPYGTLGVALFVIAAFSFVRPQLSLADGAIASAVSIMVVMSVMRWLYMTASSGTTPLIAFILPLASLPLVWIGEMRWLRVRSPFLRIPIVIGLIAAACAAAVLIAQLSIGAAGGGADPVEQMYLDMMNGG